MKKSVSIPEYGSRDKDLSLSATGAYHLTSCATLQHLQLQQRIWIFNCAETQRQQTSMSAVKYIAVLVLPALQVPGSDLVSASDFMVPHPRQRLHPVRGLAMPPHACVNYGVAASGLVSCLEESVAESAYLVTRGQGWEGVLLMHCSSRHVIRSGKRVASKP